MPICQFAMSAPRSAHENTFDAQTPSELSLPLLLSIDESCRQISCGKTYMFELLKNGEIESCLIGNRRRILTASLLAFIEKRKSPLATEAV